MNTKEEADKAWQNLIEYTTSDNPYANADCWVILTDFKASLKAEIEKLELHYIGNHPFPMMSEEEVLTIIDTCKPLDTQQGQNK